MRTAAAMRAAEELRAAVDDLVDVLISEAISALEALGRLLARRAARARHTAAQGATAAPNRRRPL